MTDYYISTSNRRESYHAKADCMGLKNAKDYMSKPWGVIERMSLGPCPWCVSEQKPNAKAE